MTIAETLRAAAARVRQGWCQWSLHDNQGNVCAMGAINDLMGYYHHSGYNGPVAQVVAEALNLPPAFSGGPDTPGRRVAIWNNQEGQTAENVAAGLEFAALYVEEKERQQREDLRAGGQPRAAEAPSAVAHRA